jgi:hypothetical protein
MFEHLVIPLTIRYGFGGTIRYRLGIPALGIVKGFAGTPAIAASPVVVGRSQLFRLMVINAIGSKPCSHPACAQPTRPCAQPGAAPGVLSGECSRSIHVR